MLTGAARHNRVRELADAKSGDAIAYEFGSKQRDVVTYERVLLTPYPDGHPLPNGETFHSIADREWRKSMAVEESGLGWVLYDEHNWYLERTNEIGTGTIGRVGRAGARGWLGETLEDVEHYGALADCAKALVEAVRGAPC